MIYSKQPVNDLQPILVGCGSGFAGDRWDAAVPVVKTLLNRKQPAALIFETLAERTLALAQLARSQNPDAGWEPSLENFVRPILRDCVEGSIPIIGNFGAANPSGAAAFLQKIAQSLGLPTLKIAVVFGDSLLEQLTNDQLKEILPKDLKERKLVSANAYLGAQAIADALKAGAQIVVTGRVADPALALGPILAHFNWSLDDWDLLAAGTMAGHLLECGAQVTGGYFADPGVKDVANLAYVGFPIIEMHSDGSFTVNKAENTGGCVDRLTVTEQLLYEIHDPANYLTPDVVADITKTQISKISDNCILVTGVNGHPRPPTLKATVCFEGGWLAEGEISYVGLNALARAQLAADVVKERLVILGLSHIKVRADFIGAVSILADDDGQWISEKKLPNVDDVRLRIAGASETKEEAQQVAREVLALYTCGPSGGGGVRTHVTPRLISDSCYVPREWLKVGWEFAE